MPRFPSTFTLALSLACLLVGTGAKASPITGGVTITFDNPIFSSGYDNVSISFPGDGGGNDSAQVAAGRFTGTASNLINVEESIFIDGLEDVYMYCFDLYDAVNGGNVVDYTIRFGEIMERTLAFIGAVNRVLNRERAAATFDPYAWVRPTSAAQSAAIQLGLWESKYDDGSPWEIDTGAFRVTGGLASGTRTELGKYFTEVNSADNVAVEQRLTMLFVNDRFQDMIAADPPGLVAAPGSLALLTLGLLGALRRRRVA